CADGVARGAGGRVRARLAQGTPPSVGLRLLYRLADLVALDHVKRSMGLHRTRGAATGAAPIAPELIKWYMALGIDMREVYGQTENCGLATAMPAGRIKLGTVGVARPDTEVRISPQAAILLKGPHLLSCLIMIDHETVAQFAQERDVPFTNFTSLCRAKEVQDLIWAEIERVNKQVARVETIRKFRLIEQILTAEDEELTPTMKLRRA